MSFNEKKHGRCILVRWISYPNTLKLFHKRNPPPLKHAWYTCARGYTPKLRLVYTHKDKHKHKPRVNRDDASISARKRNAHLRLWVCRPGSRVACACPCACVVRVDGSLGGEYVEWLTKLTKGGESRLERKPVIDQEAGQGWAEALPVLGGVDDSRNGNRGCRGKAASSERERRDGQGKQRAWVLVVYLSFTWVRYHYSETQGRTVEQRGNWGGSIYDDGGGGGRGEKGKGGKKAVSLPSPPLPSLPPPPSFPLAPVSRPPHDLLLSLRGW